MKENRGQITDVFSLIYNIVSIPYNLLAGFIVGSVVPVAVVAAIAGGIRLLTGKMPYLNVVDAEGDRQVALTLMTDDEVSEAFARDKEEIGSEIQRMQAEIQAIIEEAQAEARESAIEELEEAQEALEEA
jgi:hypothetical protein